jgi:hypothetical protein
VEGRAGFTPAVPTAGAGVAGTSSIGPGVVGITSSDNGRGVQGTSSSGPAVEGRSTSSFGVRGISTSGGGVRGRAIGDGTGVYGSSGGIGTGVVGSSTNGAGVRGEGGQWGSQPRSGGPAVEAYGWGSVGVFAQSAFDDGIAATGPRAGVRGRAGGIISSAKNGVGVYGTSTVSGGAGVRGEHNGSNPGVEGASSSGAGVSGTSTSGSGVAGTSTSGSGVAGTSTSGFGVSGTSTTGTAIRGRTTSGPGVSGISTSGSGVAGTSTSGFGVIGTSTTLHGVSGTSTSGNGVDGGSTTGFGVSGLSTGAAGVFGGGPLVGGFFLNALVVAGAKLFKLDHPLDPENRYLSHACVESSEMKNLYDGVARLDEDGAAWVELPEWFQTLNGDFRYQLTAIGGPAPNLHVAEEISENRFKIAGGDAGMKVCWQVTGTRKDRWAAAHPFEVEQDKREEERGRYLHPSLYDAPEEQSVILGRPIGEAVEKEQQPPELSGINVVRLEEEHRRRTKELLRPVEGPQLEELRRRMQREEEEEAEPEMFRS